MNRVTLLGKLWIEPRINTPKDKPKYAVLVLMTHDQWTDSNGEKKSRSDWHRIVVFKERLVAFIEENLKQGMKILIEGKLYARKVSDRESSETYASEVVIGGGYGSITCLSPFEGKKVSQEEQNTKGPSQQIGVPCKDHTKPLESDLDGKAYSTKRY
jgi:single-strand DNA-binding protein